MTQAFPDVLIVGAGLAGLAAAVRLEQAGKRCLLLEQGDAPGGRARSDTVDGFILDRGFQVLLTQYPAAAALLDYDELKLAEFTPGALIWLGDRFTRLADPRRTRSPTKLLQTAFSPAAGWLDKLRMARLPRLLETARDDQTTAQFLRQAGFSERCLARFWRPFLGGVLLERELSTPATFTAFTLRMFATGAAALPARGVGAIAQQLARRLKNSRIELAVRAVHIEPGNVLAADGRRFTAPDIIDAAPNIIDAIPPSPRGPPTRATLCLYFAAPLPPIREPTLLLDGTGEGPINTVVVPSLLSPDYAPPGQHLISLSTVGLPDGSDAEVQLAALRQMQRWFGPQVARWRHLRSSRLPHALPPVPTPPPPVQIAPGLYRAGDATLAPSSNGALQSGLNAAEAILARTQPRT
jgi:phytoene dehydrogenase-like protein